MIQSESIRFYLKICIIFLSVFQIVFTYLSRSSNFKLSSLFFFSLFPNVC
ncbi:hypothetical protein L5515_007488 [Caenorhabditis briggsae]|uniref:Uncharacterized protein n=1 Tax=Caenorhabditis briggsae TaxID=6238 RepID=A0AAE9F359_CAEBR|nr:hypothetical protein L5515_007488 [Caenorhabditis briggsae]